MIIFTAAFNSATYDYRENSKSSPIARREIPPIIVQTVPHFSVSNFYGLNKHQFSTSDPYFDTSLINKHEVSTFLNHALTHLQEEPLKNWTQRILVFERR